MSIRSILYIACGTEHEVHAMNMAFALARYYTAQLRILHVTPELELYYVDGMTANAEIAAAIEEDNDKRLKQAKEHAAHYAQLHNIVLNAADVSPNQPSARFIHRQGRVEDILTREGRMSDLIVTGGVKHETCISQDDLEAILFATGRPVLLAPRMQGAIPREWLNRVICIAWDGGLEAARALYNAMPFLERAGKVHLLTVRSHSQRHKISDEAPVMEYLNTHGIACDAVALDRGEHSTAEALLQKAKEYGAELLVMGAYGHTRLHETILGGVTGHMLKETHIPLLMSH
ncbi:MAG TPA: universal stress protein [Rickettsiales bacterium]|nr:universal stress protein [Rickettsiales bacterium]